MPNDLNLWEALFASSDELISAYSRWLDVKIRE